MKKTTLFSIIGSFMILSNQSEAKEFKLELKPKHQNQYTIRSLSSDDDEGIKGKLIIGVNAGFNMFSTLLQARYVLSDYYAFDGHITQGKASPLYHLSLDYGFAKKFSVGADIGFQNATITFGDIVTYGDSYQDKWTRILLAARADYHIVASENVSLYTGLKLGYNLYTVKSDIPENVYPGYVENMDVHPQPVSVQAHFGFSYFFQGKFGVNAEAGIGVGGPYLFSAGLAYKI